MARKKTLKIPLTVINSNTSLARQDELHMRRKLARYVLDERKEARHEMGECPRCYYLMQGRIVGQAFTRYTCQICQNEFEHQNTGVPKLCPKCSQDHLLCRRCLADIDLKDRT